LTKTNARKVWGATVPLAQTQNAQANFDNEFDQLYARLVRRRLVQLGKSATPDQQLKIFKFPGRFRRTRERLGQFSAALFRPNPFSESPLLRGFYFTSTVASGAQGARRLNGDSFFTRTLFNDVLLRDKDIVRATQAAGGQSKIKRNLLIGATAALLFTLGMGVVLSFYNNKQLIADADRRGKRLTEIRKATSRSGRRCATCSHARRINREPARRGNARRRKRPPAARGTR
jgi:type VI secretion system protein ImpL